MYGFRAAKAAAKELKEGDGFTEYVDYWKTSFGYNQPGRIEDSCRMALGMLAMEDEDLDYLFALLEPRKIKSYYDEFGYPRLIMSGIMSHIGKIRQEQPDLARKVEMLYEGNMEEIIKIGMKGYMV